MSSPIAWDELCAAAWRARESAYAPYSNYAVGAALLTADDRVFVGCNVENASYGLCLCAERSAIGAAVVAGARHFVAIAIVSQGTEPATPCGMCRQVLSEFAPAFDVRCVSESGATFDTNTEELLPFAFTPAVLGVEVAPPRSTLLHGSTPPASVEPEIASPPRTPPPPDDDPLRSTMVMGTTEELNAAERRLQTERPPPPSARALGRTMPRGSDAFVGVALKVAAGTGSELAEATRTGDAAPDTDDEGDRS